jgi:hypothetical protein
MTTRASERREVVRFAVRVPIDVNRIGRGSTVDVSATGISFLIDQELQTGVQIQFELAFDDGNSLLACDGRVVRVERRDARLFTAATIDNIEIKSRTEH